MLFFSLSPGLLGSTQSFAFKGDNSTIVFTFLRRKADFFLPVVSWELFGGTETSTRDRHIPFTKNGHTIL